MKHKRLKAYLSGGMEYAHREGMDWRKDIEIWLKKNLGHTVFNPNTESEKYLLKRKLKDEFRTLKTSDTMRFIRVVHRIVDLDSREIAAKSDYVICLWDEGAQRGAGTQGEVTIARFYKKPVYLVTEMSLTNIPGWVLGCTTKIFPSFTQLQNFLIQKYGNSRSKTKGGS
ncbi:MAG: hypothetical protein V1799_07095 [bacterium]